MTAMVAGALARIRARASRRLPLLIVAVCRRLPAGTLLLEAVADLVRPVPRPADIHPGRFFELGRGRTLPIVLFVATGMAEGGSDEIARRVELAQAMTGSFRPLFLVDGTELRPFRIRQYAVERIMPREEFEALNPYDSWAEYLYERTASIARSYRATSVVPLPCGGAERVPDEMLRLVGLGFRP